MIGWDIWRTDAGTVGESCHSPLRYLHVEQISHRL